MVQTTVPSTQSSFPLPDAFSTALTAIFDSVQPGIVQVYTERRGGGTGIIWHKDGRIITNNHVVPDDTAKIQVHLLDGRTLAARVLYRNPRLDLAMIKVEGDNLQPLSVGDSSKLRVGEWVFAIGHPWGQRWSLTAGIVSTIGTVRLAKNLATQYIKSDVQLAPGNSGGPLLNADGEVVGVNAMIFGGDLSVSIPSNVVNQWLAELPKRRVVLGVEIQTVELPRATQQALQPQRSAGVLIVSTKARREQLTDILVGDIVLDVANTPITDTATLRHILTQYTEGDTVPMRILRGGSVITLDAITQVMDDAA
jgi:serine protease Do